MRTLDDVRAAFAAIADRAPEPITTPIERPRLDRRSRGWLVAVSGTAAATAVVALTTAVVLTRDQGSTEPAATGTPPTPITLSYDFSVVAISGFTVAPTTVTPTYQQAQASYLAGGRGTGLTVRIYSPGAYDARPAQRLTPISVGPYAGYLGAVADGSGSAYESAVWQYAPDSWAVVQSDASVVGRVSAAEAAVVRRLADAVRPGKPSAMRLPFRIGYLPPGLVAVSARSLTAFSPGDGDLGLADSQPAGGAATPGVLIAVYPIPAPGSAPLCPAHAPVLAVGRYRGCALSGADGRGQEWALSVPGGWFYLTIDPSTAARYSRATLTKMVTSMSFAPNIGDSRTWFAAATTLP